MAIDLRTDLQKFRAKRAARICNLYRELKVGNAGSDTQIWKYIAEKVSKETKAPLSYMGVRAILISRKEYEPIS